MEPAGLLRPLGNPNILAMLLAAYGSAQVTSYRTQPINHIISYQEHKHEQAVPSV